MTMPLKPLPNDDHAAKFETAVNAINDDHAAKLQLYKEAVEKKYDTLLNESIEAIDNENTVTISVARLSRIGKSVMRLSGRKPFFTYV